MSSAIGSDCFSGKVQSLHERKIRIHLVYLPVDENLVGDFVGNVFQELIYGPDFARVRLFASVICARQSLP